jgi:hypothetical protein
MVSIKAIIFDSFHKKEVIYLRCLSLTYTVAFVTVIGSAQAANLCGFFAKEIA